MSKGIVLAGGSGTRLHPITKGISKQLIPIYDKPMIYYPISVLMLAGIRDILIITTPEDQSNFQRLLGDGSEFGVKLTYAIQEKPEGLAQAFLIAEECGFATEGKDPLALVLGDNIFYGASFTKVLKNAHSYAKNDRAAVFGYWVPDPQRYGVANFDEDGICYRIEEKPEYPKSNWAVVGLYFYPKDVITKAKNVLPSARGELEITSLNQMYLEEGNLSIELLPRGFAWLDTGTFESLAEASNFVETVEKRQGLQIACLEEIAYRNKWLTKEEIKEKAAKMSKNEYGQYLSKLFEIHK